MLRGDGLRPKPSQFVMDLRSSTTVTPGQRRVLFSRDVTLCCVSLIALGLILGRLYCFQPPRSRDNHLHKFVSYLMRTLFILELIATLIWTSGVVVIGLGDHGVPGPTMSENYTTALCRYLAPFLFWSQPVVYAWHVVISYSIWSWVVRHVPLPVLLKRLDWYLAATLMLGVALTIPPMIEQNLGMRPYASCYVLRSWRNRHMPMISVLIDKMITLPLACVTIATLNANTVIYMTRKVREFGYVHDPAIDRLKVRLLVVTMNFVVLWLLYAVPLFLNDRRFEVELAVKWAMLLPFCDAMAFGWPECVRWRRPTPAARPGLQLYTHRELNQGNVSEMEDGELQGPQVPPPPPSASSVPHAIFATTFDMNHATVCSPHGLDAWIPSSAGYHVYVIAVQRCRVLPRLKQMLHAHLGGSAKYVLTGCAELGDAVTGKLALLVFTRTVDVESRAFRPVASPHQSVRLGRIRGATKGLLGLSFRYHDVSLAFICAHLPSLSMYHDNGAKVERNKHLAQLLRSLHLGRDDENWDTHLQHHHVYLLGNLNWRSVGMSGDAMLQRVVNSSQACQMRSVRQAGEGGSGWRDEAFLRFRLYPSLSAEELQRMADTPMGAAVGIEEELETGLMEDIASSYRSSSQDDWDWVRGADLLTAGIGRGEVLHGFHEPPITFPPSFKWQVGRSAGDFCDPDGLKRAYALHDDLKEPGTPRQKQRVSVPPLSNAAGRTPSYNDRILVHSMPSVRHRLLCCHYDLCEWGDMARSSDHRPVSLAATLVLDTTYTDSCNPRDARVPRPTGVSSTAAAMAAVTRNQRRGGNPTSPNSCPIFTLVSLGLRNFNFRLTGFKIFLPPPPPLPMPVRSRSSSYSSQDEDELKDEDVELPAFVGPSAARLKGSRGSRSRSSSRPSSEEEKAPPPPSEPTALQREDSDPPMPPWSLLRSGSSWFSGLSGSMHPSSSANDLREMGGRLRAVRSRGNLRNADDAEAPRTFVKTVLILYPVPTEDPQASLRRLQQVGTSMSQSAPEAAVAGGGQRKIHRLQSLHTVAWQPEYEDGGRGRVHVSTELVVSSGACPTHCCRHALIKFLGQSDEELGQGVFSISSEGCGSGGGCTSGRRTKTVDLSVGGDYRGSVSFDLDVKVRKKNAATAAAAVAAAAAAARG